MALPVELDPRAEEEARAAFLWYRERSERAAAAFEQEIEAAIDQIGESPARYPVAEVSVGAIIEGVDQASRGPSGAMQRGRFRTGSYRRRGKRSRSRTAS